MKFDEILWVIKTLNLKPIRDLEISIKIDDTFTITSSTKRVDIIRGKQRKATGHRYIRIYNDLNDLSTYFQTDFDKYMGKSDVDITKLYENHPNISRGVIELNE